MRSISGTVVALLILLLSPASRGQAQFRDEVVIEGPTGGRIIQKCEVLDYTGRGLTARIPMGTGRIEYTSSEIVSVNTWLTEAHSAAGLALKENRLEAALVSGERAIKEEMRAWVRRDILALLVRCELRRGDLTAAGRRFLLIIDSDPLTPHLPLIPLRWDQQSVPATDRAIAQVWLRSTGSMPRLLGASQLLMDTGLGSTAASTLETLTREPGESVRQLAQWQLLRLRLSEGRISDLDLDLWESRLERLDHRFHAGPWFIIGQGYRQREQHERAAAAFLRLPLVYDGDHPMTASALSLAADSLDRIGQRKEAAKLREELHTRWPQFTGSGSNP